MTGNAMARAEDYRRYAAECLALAQRPIPVTAPAPRNGEAFNVLAAKAAAATIQGSEIT